MKLWVSGDPVPPEFIEASSSPASVVSAFNDNFERSIEQHIMVPRYGFPTIPIERHRCTQASARALALPGSLAGVAEALGLEQQKDAAGQALMKQMARPRKPRPTEDPNGVYWFDDEERRKQLYEYCKTDVMTERAIHKRIGHLPDAEQKVWIGDTATNDRGFCIDPGLIAGAINIGTAAQAALNVELYQVTGGEISTIGQTEKMITWLGDHGVTIKDVQKETVATTLERTDLPSDARRVLELRRDGAHIAAAKYETMTAWASTDNRIRGAFQYHQASTGRWASHGVQTQNLKKANGLDIEAAIELVKSGDLARMREHYANPLSVVGEVTRATIVAAPNHYLIIADFSGIESRVLAGLAGEKSKLDLWRQYDQTDAETDDVYYKLGKKFGFADDVARKQGKIADLAFGFSGGVGAFRKFAGEGATDEEANKLKRDWRNAHPNIVRLWKDLNAGALRAVANPNTTQKVNDYLAWAFDGTFLFMQLPSGRCLSYPFPRLEPGKYDQKVVIFKDNSGGKFIDCRNGEGAWPGLWIENAVQAVARDILVAAMQRLEAADYPIVMHIHDEIVVEVPIGFGSEEELLQIMTVVPSWAKDLPINAKVRSGLRFCKTKSDQIPEAPAVEAHESDTAPAVEAAPWEDHPSDTPSPPLAPETPEQTSWQDEPGAYQASGSGSPRYASGEREWGETVAEYIYKDQFGRPYLKVARTSKKQFPQYHLEGDRWVKGPSKGRKIPYRLPELLPHEPESLSTVYHEAWVHLFEGEKDADNGAALGLVATAHSQGAEGWSDDLVPWFIGRKVVIHEDNDNAGRKHTRAVVAALQSVTKEIRVLTYEDLPEHGDFSDWLEQGYTRADIEQRVAAASAYESDLEVWDAGEDDENIEPRGWLLGNIFCREFLSSLLGDGGVGKTALRITQLMSCAIGRSLTGEHVFKRSRVLLVSLEDSTKELRRRVKACRIHHKVSKEDLKQHLILSCPGPDAGKLMEMDEKGRLALGALRAKLERTIIKHKIDIISLDPFVKAHAVGENDNNAIDKVVGVLTDLAHKHDLAVDVPHHVSKGAAEPGNAQKGRGATAFADGGRLVYTLGQMSPDDAKIFGIKEEERRYYIRMDKGKVNITPPARAATWFKLVGVPLGNANDDYPDGDNVQTVEPWTPPETWAGVDAALQNAILDDIDKGLPDGTRYSHANAAKTRAAWRVVQTRIPDKNDKQCREIIQAWINGGVLYEDDCKDSKGDPAKGLFVEPGKRPT